MQKTAIIGSTSELAQAVRLVMSCDHDITMIGRDALDFCQASSIADIACTLCEFDCIINCAGLTTGTAQEIFMVNAVGPIALMTELTQHGCQARVIFVGSHGAMWTAWPGASQSRILYNISKRCLQDFVVAMSHARSSEMQLCIYNASRFQTRMSGYTGHELDTIAQQVRDILHMDPMPVLIEMESPDAR